MMYHDYLAHLQSLAKVVLTPIMPKTMNRPLGLWWPQLLVKAGVSEIVIGQDQGEALTWEELVLVHGYLIDVATKQFEQRVLEGPEKNGREVLAQPLPASALKQPKEQAV